MHLFAAKPARFVNRLFTREFLRNGVANANVLLWLTHYDEYESGGHDAETTMQPDRTGAAGACELRGNARRSQG